jgi:uncharacterized protein (DUF924 family)
LADGWVSCKKKEASMSEPRAIVDPEEVLSYWFPPGYDANPEALWQHVMRWFQGGPEFDQEIAEQFTPVLEQARRGELEWWADTLRGRLALIIVLDQFSRSVYRGTPLAYAQDPAALRLALSGIEEGMERDLALMERLFFTLPLGHAEGPDLPERAKWMLRQAEEMVELAPPHLRWMYEHSLSQAKAHNEVIARFGRYPHRNEVLGRSSTPEELEYLREEVPVHRRKPPEAPSAP